MADGGEEVAVFVFDVPGSGDVVAEVGDFEDEGLDVFTVKVFYDSRKAGPVDTRFCQEIDTEFINLFFALTYFGFGEQDSDFEDDAVLAIGLVGPVLERDGKCGVEVGLGGFEDAGDDVAEFVVALAKGKNLSEGIDADAETAPGSP